MKFLFVIFLLPLQLFAQDITGVWTGTLYSDTTQFIKYELAISEYNGKLSGYSHTIFVIDGIENIGVKSIKIKRVGGKFLLEDDKLVYNNYTDLPGKGVKQYSKLLLSQNDTALVLSGLWKTNRTKEYQGIAGIIFLQKKKKIKETLIIEELENLGLAGALSFMVAPSQPRDLAIIRNTGFNPLELKKQPVENVEDVVSNAAPANIEIQQPGKQSKAGKPIAEEVLSKESSSNKNAQIKDKQLPVADIAMQKDRATDIASAGKVLAKSEPQQTNEQQADKKIPGEVLNKDDSAVNKAIIKNVPSPVTEISIQKNEPGSIGLAKSETQQINTQQKADKKIPREVLNKDDSAVNKAIIKNVPSPVTEISIQKNKPGSIGLTKSETQQINTQQKADKKIPEEVLNKNDNTVDKGIVKNALSSLAVMSIPKSEPTSIGSTKSETQQINIQQTAGKEIPEMVLMKGNIDSIKTEIKIVSQPAAKIATRKIEAIRSVNIKSDSLLLSLYDNGEIDGDTVSILLNGKVIMPMQGLTLKAINKTIYLTPEMGDSIVLIMYAENLGSIPPNTGLLVVHDGDDIYEIRFTGDLEKNSSIILKRKRKN